MGCYKEKYATQKVNSKCKRRESKPNALKDECNKYNARIKAYKNNYK